MQLFKLKLNQTKESLCHEKISHEIMELLEHNSLWWIGTENGGMFMFNTDTLSTLISDIAEYDMELKRKLERDLAKLKKAKIDLIFYLII